MILGTSWFETKNNLESSNVECYKGKQFLVGVLLLWQLIKEVPPSFLFTEDFYSHRYIVYLSCQGLCRILMSNLLIKIVCYILHPVPFSEVRIELTIGTKKWRCDLIKALHYCFWLRLHFIGAVHKTIACTMFFKHRQSKHNL